MRTPQPTNSRSGIIWKRRDSGVGFPCGTFVGNLPHTPSVSVSVCVNSHDLFFTIAFYGKRMHILDMNVTEPCTKDVNTAFGSGDFRFEVHYREYREGFCRPAVVIMGGASPGEVWIPARHVAKLIESLNKVLEGQAV